MKHKGRRRLEKRGLPSRTGRGGLGKEKDEEEGRERETGGACRVEDDKDSSEKAEIDRREGGGK